MLEASDESQAVGTCVTCADDALADEEEGTQDWVLARSPVEDAEAIKSESQLKATEVSPNEVGPLWLWP